MRFLILTGMSGAGKTVAIRHLEDSGALCVDNLPPMMLVPFMDSCKSAHLRQSMVAIAADVRSGEFFDAKAVSRMIDEARMVGFQIDTLYFEASDDVLVSRYKETRRDHPLTGEGLSLSEAIREERTRLMPLRETANHLIDTSGMKPRALQKRLNEIIAESADRPPLSVEIMSFGFKRGIPREGDLVFDVRFLPNPFYIPELGHQTGLDEDVRNYVLSNAVTEEFLRKCTELLDFLLPNYINEGKHRLVIAVGCTGGAHRSVVIAESLTAHLKEQGYSCKVNHRDLALEQAHWETRSDYQKGEP